MSTIIMVAVAFLIIYKMVTSTQDSIASMEVSLEKHFSKIEAGHYREAYDAFHDDLKKRISFAQYEASWLKRIEDLGPMKSWEIHTANKSSNLFTGEKEYDFVLFISFTNKEQIFRVTQTWKVEGENVTLVYSGLHSSATNSSSFDVF
ncbi:hypothetical protein [Thiorhodovibrio frisius]|uniref:hypothetical protein n=1 Tax=Thiorhodovibrio frisius TaxID=631362 RepID=UPI00117F90E1|nr:hypothetical protein [Thiorhodovibrio frisius]